MSESVLNFFEYTISFSAYGNPMKEMLSHFTSEETKHVEVKYLPSRIQPQIQLNLESFHLTHWDTCQLQHIFFFALILLEENMDLGQGLSALALLTFGVG